MSQLALLPEKSEVTSTKPPVIWFNDVFDGEFCNKLLQKSLGLDWLHNEWSMLGQTGKLPRKEIIFGDEPYRYTYSKGKVVLDAQPWPKWLAHVRDDIEYHTGIYFPLVIGNLYEGGHHHIGWHDDGRPELGEMPAIASLSLGATRKFQLRRKPSFQGERTEIFNYELNHGDLLVMQPGCQEDWLHKLAKTNKAVSHRVNWTFRPWESVA